MPIVLKKLFTIFLPLADNNGVAFPESIFEEVGNELVRKFGGATRMKPVNQSAYLGQWFEPISGATYTDEIVVVLVLTDPSSAADEFFIQMKEDLKRLFHQLDILTMAHTVEVF
jgi:hypothetical protein